MAMDGLESVSSIDNFTVFDSCLSTDANALSAHNNTDRYFHPSDGWTVLLWRCTKISTFIQYRNKLPGNFSFFSMNISIERSNILLLLLLSLNIGRSLSIVNR